MFRLKKIKSGKLSGKNQKKNQKKIRKKTIVKGDVRSLEMMMHQPKRVLHSKNPFKIKKPKIRWERKIRDQPLDGVTILKICKCELPEEVLKLDLSGKGYKSIYQTDLKYFSNILEADLSENFLEFKDIEVLLNLNSLNFQANKLKEIESSPNCLPNLQILDLSFNTLTPNSLSSLTTFKRLKNLTLAANKLSELPQELTELQTLTSLDISHNEFKSDERAAFLWRVLADFRNLKELTLSHNQLKGIHTERLEAGDFDILETLDFRNNLVDDQLKLICSRNFPNLKQLFVTGNPFVNFDTEYLNEEIQSRVGGELVNETVGYKLRKNILRKRPIPIVFENIVVIKEDDFKAKVNTEFFGVDIPLNLIKEKEGLDENQAKEAEDEEEERREGFFITEADTKNKKKQQASQSSNYPSDSGLQERQEIATQQIPKNIFDLKLDKVLDHRSLDYNQFLSLTKLYLGSEIEYDRVDDLNDSYRKLKNHMRTATRLDMKISNPSYMRPLKTKFRTLKAQKAYAKLSNNGNNLRDASQMGSFNQNLSAHNPDKKMHGIKFLVDNMEKKLNRKPRGAKTGKSKFR